MWGIFFYLTDFLWTSTIIIVEKEKKELKWDGTFSNFYFHLEVLYLALNENITFSLGISLQKNKKKSPSDDEYFRKHKRYMLHTKWTAESAMPVNKEKGLGTLYPAKNCLLTIPSPRPPSMAGTTHNCSKISRSTKSMNMKATSDPDVDWMLVSPSLHNKVFPQSDGGGN